MIRQLSAALLVALAGSALLAGCGSSSGSTTSSSTSSSSTAATSPAKVPASAAVIEKCRHDAKALSTLPQATKSRLESICDRAASGDAKAIRTASREACEEIVKASPLPEGSAKQHALAGCKAAGQGK